MKKVIALILAALMVLGLAACAAKTTTTEQDTDTPAQTAPADKASIELYPFANITFLVLGYDSSAMAKAVLNLS